MASNEVPQTKKKRISLDRRLRLAELSPGVRGPVLRSALISLLACLMIVFFGMGLYPFETPFQLPVDNSPLHHGLEIPLSLVFLLPIGLGIVAGSLLRGAYQPAWRPALLLRLAVAALGLTFPLSFLQVALKNAQPGSFAGMLGFGLVVFATACGVAALVGAFFSSPRVAFWTPRLASATFFAMSLALLMFVLQAVVMAMQGNDRTDTFLALLRPMGTFITYLVPFTWLAGAIFFWQAITEVKVFSREVGLRLADAGMRIAWLLGALFAVKFIWLAAGYWGMVRGTAGETWTAPGKDGPGAWILAALFAVGAAWWLTRKRISVDTGSFDRAAVFLTAGFLLLFIAAFLVFIPAGLLTGLGLDGAGGALGNLSLFLASLGGAWTRLFAALLLPLGLVCLRWRRFRPLALPLLLSGVWVLPSVLDQLTGVNLSFEYLTFDIFLTFVLFGLAIPAWRGRQPRTNLWVITLILVVSTLTALAESLVPRRYELFAFALLLVIPVIYQLLFDAKDLNEMGRSQGERLVRNVGFQAGLMLVVAASFVLTLMAPGDKSFELVADKIFLPPMLALYLMAAITQHLGLQAAKPE